MFLSRIDAIDLLTANSSVLNDTNKQLLKTLKIQKRARAFDNKEARPHTKQNNDSTDRSKLHKDSRKTAKEKLLELQESKNGEKQNSINKKTTNG